MPKNTTKQQKLPKLTHDPVTMGSSNLFADLDFSDANLHLEKVKLAVKIADLIKGRNLLQKETARLLKIDQPKVSRLLRGLVREFSLEKLMEFAGKLGAPHEVSEKIIESPGPMRTSSAPIRRKEFPVMKSRQFFDAQSVSIAVGQCQGYRGFDGRSYFYGLAKSRILHSSPVVQSIF